MHIEQKIILLAGACGGIGREIARQLDSKSARLLLIGRDKDKLQQLQSELSGKHRAVIADINAPRDRDAIFQASMEEGIDMYINAAGVMDFNFYETQNIDQITQMISTNLVSPMLLCQRLLPMLQQREEAAIVNIGSTFGSIGHPGFVAYCASKFGLRGFSQALKRELADSNIRVLYLAPRATRTELNSSNVTALNKALGNATDPPEQVANELMRLLAGKRKQPFMGWPENIFVRVNGLFPSLVNQAIFKKLSIIRRFANL